MGKMISAQSIVVACTATAGRPDSPSEGAVLRSVFRYSVVLALLMGVLVVIQVYVLPWFFPGGLASLGGSAAP
jgi:lactate permease